VDDHFPCHADYGEEDETKKGEQFMARFCWVMKSLSIWRDRKERFIELLKVWRFTVFTYGMVLIVFSPSGISGRHEDCYELGV
jgi:hypothetical protein